MCMFWGYIEASASLKNLPVFLYGHSWGGYTAAAVLNFKHNIAGVITISGFSSPMAITKEAAGRIIPTLLVDLLLPFAALYQRIVLVRIIICLQLMASIAVTCQFLLCMAKRMK